MLGDDVLTEGGASLGKVADLVLMVGSGGEVVGYQIDKTGGGRGYVPLPAQLSVSGLRWWSRTSPRSSSKTTSSDSARRWTSSGLDWD